MLQSKSCDSSAHLWELQLDPVIAVFAVAPGWLALIGGHMCCVGLYVTIGSTVSVVKSPSLAKWVEIVMSQKQRQGVLCNSSVESGRGHPYVTRQGITLHVMWTESSPGPSTRHMAH